MISIPDKLPSHATYPLYQTEQFFPEDNMKCVHCYTHDADLKFPIGMHHHTFYEINLVTSGKGLHYINNEKIEIAVGDLFVLPPNIEHGYFEISNLQIFHILLDSKFFSLYKKHLKAMNGYDSLFNIEPQLRSAKYKKSFLHLSKSQFEQISIHIEQLLEHTEKNTYSCNIQAAIVFQMICTFCKYYNETISPAKTPRSNSRYTPSIIYAMEYINKNLSNELTINTIASNNFMSSTTFKRYFTEIVGIPPMQYVTQKRIELSKKMLRSTDKSITFIAYETGFSDSSHFIHQFKKNVGCTPLEYRKSILKT